MRFIMHTAVNDEARPRLASGVRLHIDCTTGKAVLLFPEGILELNKTAQEILTRCDGRTVSQIARELAEGYDVQLETIVADTRVTLAELQRRNLIVLA
jgi:pyrroloquinoline quinone biosynthesis protein D